MDQDEALESGGVQLSREQWEWARARAKEEDRSVASVIRRAVKDAMEGEKPNGQG